MIYVTVLFTFYGFESCKVKVPLKLGVFSDANVLKKWSDVNPKVGVRLKIGCSLN